MSSQLELNQVCVNYGDVQAVRDVSLSLAKGQIGCLLGPSGCGKTTLLRAIAGFEPLSRGEIILHDRVISAPGHTLPPERRRVGMVFQDFALFPHLDVGRNIGFGLSGLPRDRRRQRVAELLDLVGLAPLADAYPHQLSGGQQQRVALARALAPAPEILLLDEPFSSLDTELREQLAREVRELLQRNGVTAILVTHDQHEAFAMADQVTLLRDGRVAQSDTPYNLYHKPTSEFAAGFMGQGSVIRVNVNGHGELDNHLGRLGPAHARTRPGEVIKLLIRPDDVEYAPDSVIRLPVVSRQFRGAHYLYRLRLPDGQQVPCLAPSHVEVPVGSDLPVQFELGHVVLFSDDA